MAEKFDLIPANERCDTLRVVFDFYTPRPHFIILPRNTAIKKYHDFDQGAKLKVVKAALSMVSEYKLQELAVLSLHFGKWYNPRKHFHAHLCVDVETYLDIFERTKRRVRDWPLDKYVSKEWKESRDPNDYAINVRAYPFKSYFQSGVGEIRKYRTSSTGRSNVSRPPSPSNFFFHPKEPRVGLAVEKSKKPRNCESLFKALEEMINYAGENNLTKTGAKLDEEGCHVCLVLDGKSHGFHLEDSQCLVGFIQVSGLKFYRDLCPPDQQDEWFDNFSAMPDYRVST